MGCACSDIYRPREPEPKLVLLMRTPYDKTLAQSDIGYAQLSWVRATWLHRRDSGIASRGLSEGVSSSTIGRKLKTASHDRVGGLIARLPDRLRRYVRFSYVGYVQPAATPDRRPLLRDRAQGSSNTGRMFDAIY
jgi:hypothetical protein